MLDSIDIKNPQAAKKRYKIDKVHKGEKDLFITAARDAGSHPSVDEESGFYSASLEKRNSPLLEYDGLMISIEA